MENKSKTFEDCYDEIYEIVKSKRKRWVLTDLGYIDYEDVIQIILSHIYSKWHTYDQTRPLSRWVNRVTLNQMQNIYRKEYGYIARPCNGCANNQGGDLCAITTSGRQCDECVLYQEWIKNKKIGYEMKLPADIEDSMHDIKLNDVNFDLENKIKNLHNHMMSILDYPENKIYHYSYVENKKPDEIRKILGYGNKQKSIAYIRQMQIKITAIAKEEIRKEKVDL